MNRTGFTEEQLRAAVIEYAKALYAPEPDNVPEHVFSKRYEERKRQNIERAEKLDAKRRRRSAALKVLRSVAAVFIVLIISLAMVMTFSQTARAAVINWFTETYNKIVYYRFNHAEDDHAVLICEPGALPEGFERVIVTHNGYYFKKIYKNHDTGEYIRFEYYKPTEKQIEKISAAGSDAEKYLIFGYYEAFLVQSGTEKQLCWYDPDRNLAFYVESDMKDKESFLEAFSEKRVRLPHFEPMWIPEGYEECERVDEYPSFSVYYKEQDSDRFIYFDVYDLAESNMLFVQKGVGEDMDDVVCEMIMIGLMKAYYYPSTEHDSSTELILIDEEQNLEYWITAELYIDDLCKIAESIQCMETSW